MTGGIIKFLSQGAVRRDRNMSIIKINPWKDKTFSC
jgi:hypothetical protein